MRSPNSMRKTAGPSDNTPAFLMFCLGCRPVTGLFHGFCLDSEKNCLVFGLLSVFCTCRPDETLGRLWGPSWKPWAPAVRPEESAAIDLIGGTYGARQAALRLKGTCPRFHPNSTP